MQPSRRQVLQGTASTGGVALSFGCLAAARPRAPSGHPPTPTERAQPIDLQRRGTYDGVIDLYFENSHVDLAQAKRLGVQAVIYRTSLGLYDRLQERQAYHAAKAKARDLGLLWGAFHVPSHEDVDRQLTNFFAIEEASDQTTLMALDWEGTTQGTATPDQLHQMVGGFRRARGFYPVIYGGHTLRDHCGARRDDVLAKCPLWYVYLLTKKWPVLKLPKATWSDYTLWQYATEARAGEDPYPHDVLPGADWSRFKGTVADLRRAWPFRIS